MFGSPSSLVQAARQLLEPDFDPRQYSGFLGWWSAVRVAFGTDRPGVQGVPEMMGNTARDMGPTTTSTAASNFLTWKQDPLSGGRPTLQQDLAGTTPNGFQATVPAPPPLTVYVTFYLSGSTTQDVVGFSTNGTAVANSMRWFSSGGTTHNFRVFNAGNLISVSPVTLNQLHVACISYAASGSLSQVWFDDAVNVKGSVVTNGVIPAMTNIFILSNAGGASEFGGRIGDVLLFTGSHDTPTRQQIMSFLAKKNQINQLVNGL